MSKGGRRAGRLVAGVAFATLLASCAFAVSTPAQDVHETSARLAGKVGNTVTGPTSYWFEYGPSVAYGVSTTHRSIAITDTTHAFPVTEPVSGLLRGREYHSRLCALGADAHDVCGRDEPFSTVGDSVTGSGVVFSIPELGYAIAASVDASSEPDGSDPAGSAGTSPGYYYFRLVDSGVVTCLHIAGNRAAIGFIAQPPIAGDPDVQPVPEMIFVEDNGPTGDRIGKSILSAPATTCPAPTADFPNFTFGGQQIPPVLASGDFVVHDGTTQ